jgi:hypothetical protein
MSDKLSWVEFCKKYAEAKGIKYSEAMKEAAPAYKKYKGAGLCCSTEASKTSSKQSSKQPTPKSSTPAKTPKSSKQESSSSKFTFPGEISGYPDPTDSLANPSVVTPRALPMQYYSTPTGSVEDDLTGEGKSKPSWAEFCKEYAKVKGIKYGDALKEAAPAYKKFKEMRGGGVFDSIKDWIWKNIAVPVGKTVWKGVTTRKPL